VRYRAVIESWFSPYPWISCAAEEAVKIDLNHNQEVHINPFQMCAVSLGISNSRLGEAAAAASGVDPHTWVHKEAMVLDTEVVISKGHSAFIGQRTWNIMALMTFT
jgi:hypothetical protein